MSRFAKPATVGTEKNISENRTNIKKDIRFGVEVLPRQFMQCQPLILTQERPPRNGPYKVLSVLRLAFVCKFQLEELFSRLIIQ